MEFACWNIPCYWKYGEFRLVLRSSLTVGNLETTFWDNESLYSSYECKYIKIARRNILTAWWTLVNTLVIPSVGKDLQPIISCTDKLRRNGTFHHGKQIPLHKLVEHVYSVQWWKITDSLFRAFTTFLMV